MIGSYSFVDHLLKLSIQRLRRRASVCGRVLASLSYGLRRRMAPARRRDWGRS